MYCYYVNAVNLPLSHHATVTVKLYITCNSNYPQSNSTRQGNVTGFPPFVCELLARSQYASGRSCDRPSKHTFSWVFKQRSGWLPPLQVATASFSCLIKINPLALKWKVTEMSKLCALALMRTKILRSAFQAAAVTILPHSSYVFIFILFLPEGRTGEALKPNNK